MTQEELEEIKELEKKIKKIQADIDCLCDLINRVEDKKNVNITISHLIGVSLDIDGNFVDFAMIDAPQRYDKQSRNDNYSIDRLINNLMTEKRLMEIDLNVLKAGYDED